MFSAVPSALGMDPPIRPQTLRALLARRTPQRPPRWDQDPRLPLLPPRRPRRTPWTRSRPVWTRSRRSSRPPDETKIRESVRNRIKLESVAEAHGSFDAAMSDDLLRAAIVKQLEGVDVSTKSSAYIEARYDSAIEARACS